MKILIQTIIVFIVIVVFAEMNNAQTDNEETTVVKDTSGACEINSLLVDRFRTDVDGAKRAFIVFRPGDGEGSATLNRRYHRVSRFLRRNKGLNSGNVIYSRGETVKGQGKIEFYLEGSLKLVILSRRGRIPCMDYIDAAVYP
jgi:hypothetical protein